MIIDSHVHLHELSNTSLKNYCGLDSGYILLAVSDDLKSSKRTLQISLKCNNVVPAVGIHPWNAHIINEYEIEQVLRLNYRAKFFGEIGLDLKFMPKTFQDQLRIFRKFLAEAERRAIGLSIHGVGAWKYVINELRSYRIKAVAAHWFTGTHKELKELLDYGSFIGVNSAIKIQKKSRNIVKETPLESILTESDAPYNYRGLVLEPETIQETIKIISELKRVNASKVQEAIVRNFQNFIKRAGVSNSFLDFSSELDD